LASHELDGLVQDKLSSTPSAPESLSDDGLESHGGEMCEAFGISSDCLDRTGEGKHGTARERGGLGIIRESSPVLRSRHPNAVALICSPVASPAKTSPSPASGRDSKANAPASSGKSFASRKSSRHRGDFSRTSQGFLVPIMDAICGPSSTGYGNAGLLSAGGFWTASISESPSGAVACSLSAVLQKQVSPKYSLSPKAAQGILRRAEKRGRKLPPALHQALTDLVSTSRDDGQRTM